MCGMLIPAAPFVVTEATMSNPPYDSQSEDRNPQGGYPPPEAETPAPSTPSVPPQPGPDYQPPAPPETPVYEAPGYGQQTGYEQPGYGQPDYSVAPYPAPSAGTPPTTEPYAAAGYPAASPYPTAPGTAPYAEYGAPVPHTNSLAVASLVCSLAGLIVGISAIAGVICGHIALGQIRRTGEGGRGLAIGGLVVGYAVIVLGILALVVVFAILGIATSTSTFST